MRNILFFILTAILIVGLVIMVVSGINIGKIAIPSVKEISEQNDNLDTKIDELQTIINSNYQNAKSNLNESFENLQTSKQKYLNMINYSTEEEIKTANQTQKYELGFLWTKIGLYATKNKVEMQANVSASSISGLYDISFTAIGEYIAISEFIYAIENDSMLGFKIENFQMVSNGSSSTTTEDGEIIINNSLRATFKIRNIPIDEESLLRVLSDSTRQTASSTQETTENDDES